MFIFLLKFTQVNFIYSYKEEFMLYKKTGTNDNPHFMPIKGKKNILRETTRAIAEYNMSEISAEDMIMPKEIIEGVTLGLMREIVYKVEEDLLK